VLPPVGIALAAVQAQLESRQEANREELFSALVKRVQEHSKTFESLTETQINFLKKEFPGLVIEAVRRAEVIRSKERIGRFAAILTHSIEVGAYDGADYVEEMLRIATELSDCDVRVLDAAWKEFVVRRAETPARDRCRWTRLDLYEGWHRRR